MNVTRARLMGRSAICAAYIAMLAGTTADAQVPPGRYTTTGGTVHDSMTNLTWQQISPSVTYTWALAKTYCTGAGTTLGGAGWRLPTVKELLTIVDDSRSNPSLDVTAFGPTPTSFSFWSSSPVAGPPGYAWTVNFDIGVTISAAITDSVPVRCVR